MLGPSTVTLSATHDSIIGRHSRWSRLTAAFEKGLHAPEGVTWNAARGVYNRGHDQHSDSLGASGVWLGAVVADNGVVINYVANNPGGKFKSISDKDFVPEQYGIALKKGNTELQAKLNKGLAEIRADGSYDAIFTKYFGAPPAKGAAPAAPAPAASK